MSSFISRRAVSTPNCPGAEARSTLAKVADEPKSVPVTRETAPQPPMLMLMTGFPVLRRAAHVAYRSASTSSGVRGITATLRTSAPSAFIVSKRSFISASGGVASKLW